jgi:glycyl-tRNA synthetase alpha subunit
MATKSQELLTKPAQIAAKELKDAGWKQKEYLSAGVVALQQSTIEQKMKYKQLAYNLDEYEESSFLKTFNDLPEEKKRKYAEKLEGDTFKVVLVESSNKKEIDNKKNLAKKVVKSAQARAGGRARKRSPHSESGAA